MNAALMLAETHTDEDRLVMELTAAMAAAGGDAAVHDSYRDAFRRLCSRLALYPAVAPRPSAVFESAANTARNLAASCLPLGIAVTMHLYPLCALQCVPLPMFSVARVRRSALLRIIRNRSLILANAGGERANGAHQPLTATRAAGGIRVDGTYEYMSLASVADVALFRATLADSGSTVFCAADLRSDSVRIGKWKFSGSMRLSDTASVTFINHRVPHERYLIAPGETSAGCILDYQRCWFHLFLAEIHLARLERLHRAWGLRRDAEQIVSLNEMSRLREYALHLLDDFSEARDLDSLTKTTSALKLRVSLLAQSTASILRAVKPSVASDVQQLDADASELSYIKWQPTTDEKILRSLGVG